ncbi:putative amidase signature enzyme [Rosellinia necatrix]|uniref:Putative amidase signature enzyme n=1 Tax=Rosellinia necatrix TaxID=77044 RepID=A0A1S8A8N0_ROSNE|nr:putative amidase signature enzyme [Rosellinia necatrix]
MQGCKPRKALDTRNLVVLTTSLIMAALAKSASSLRSKGFEYKFEILAKWAPGENTSPVPSVLEISMDEISNGFSTGAFSATDLVRAYLERIQQVNDAFKSVLETSNDAFQIARELDGGAKKLGPRGHMLLLPFSDHQMKGLTIDLVHYTAFLFC